MDADRSLLETTNAMLAMVLYMLMEERRAAHPLPPPPEITDETDPHCAWCNFETTANGSANIRRSLNAHTRQMHPEKWRAIHTAK